MSPPTHTSPLDMFRSVNYSEPNQDKELKRIIINKVKEFKEFKKDNEHTPQ